MKQISQNYKTGEIKVQEVVEPLLKSRGILVETSFSVVSLGTEGMKAREGKLSYVGKAKARPDQVKKVVQSVQQQGLWSTYRKVINKLDSLTPLGYSTSGIVKAVADDVTDFRVGDRVACAGVGYANHSEVNFVPSKLAVKIPQGVKMEDAAFSTVGAIAMQGYRQANMQLGEVAFVVGLGLLGQILVQILSAAGIKVLGCDLDKKKCELARQHGAEYAVHPTDEELLSFISKATNGKGIDCSFITAGGNSNGPAELAVQIARDRGKVVVIGKSKMDLDWKDYYEKELEIKYSRSYGPGRYDANYEERGIDYPIGYVRWTENRNIESFLYLLDKAVISFDKLISKKYSFEEAPDLYDKLAKGENIGIGVLFDYKVDEGKREETINKPSRVFEKTDLAVLGVIGAGNYASSMLLPFLKQNSDVVLHTVNTTASLTGENAKLKFGFKYHSTDVNATLNNEEINSILIATRHKTHASFVAAALKANKSVFVEKPLALNQAELELIRKSIVESGNDRIQVGFNRRFSRAVKKLADFWKERKSTIFTANYRVHAGQMDDGSWYLDSSEGTRFLGEGGHFIDTISYIFDSRPVSVYAQTMSGGGEMSDNVDNVSAIITYQNGSVANLQYLTQGGDKVPKEYLEVHGNGKTAILDNFTKVYYYDKSTTKKLSLGVVDKGQKIELKEFINSVRGISDFPISIDELFDTTLTTIAIQKSFQESRLVNIAEFWNE